MPARGPRLICPRCHKRGVTLRQRPAGEDHYGCQYCEWWAFTSGSDQIDIQRRSELRELNSDHPLRPPEN